MSSSRSEPPGEMPQVPPRDLHPTSDIRFVIHELGKLTAEVRQSSERLEKLADKVEGLDRTVDRFRVTFKVVSICLGLFLPLLAGVFWWALGARITALLVQQ